MHQDVDKLILSEEQIADKVKEAAAWLDSKFADTTALPIAISVLKGSAFFFCDVVRAMRTPVQLEFMRVSSYGNSTQSTGTPRIIMILTSPCRIET